MKLKFSLEVEPIPTRSWHNTKDITICLAHFNLTTFDEFVHMLETMFLTEFMCLTDMNNRKSYRSACDRDAVIEYAEQHSEGRIVCIFRTFSNKMLKEVDYE